MIHSLYFHGDEIAAVDLNRRQLAAAAADPAGVLWIDIENPADQELDDVLSGVLGCRSSLSRMWRVGATAQGLTIDGGTMLVRARMPDGSPEDEPERRARDAAPGSSSIVLGLFLQSRSIVTVHDGPIPLVATLWSRIVEDASLLAGGSDRILAELMQGAADWKLRRLEALERSAAGVAAAALGSGASSALPTLHLLVEEAYDLRESSRDEAAALETLAAESASLVSIANRVYFRSALLAARAAEHKAVQMTESGTRAVVAAMPAAVARLQTTLRRMTLLMAALALVALVALALAIAGRMPMP